MKTRFIRMNFPLIPTGNLSLKVMRHVRLYKPQQSHGALEGHLYISWVVIQLLCMGITVPYEDGKFHIDSGFKSWTYCLSQLI